MRQFIGRRGRMILLDITGVFLVIISPITGLIPGPGGIPVFLAGLGLLSINHEWARRLLVYIKEKGSDIASRIFVEHPLVKWLYDVVGVVLMFLGAWLIIRFTSNLIQAFAVGTALAGLALFLVNRKRLKTFVRWIRGKSAQ